MRFSDRGARRCRRVPRSSRTGAEPDPLRVSIVSAGLCVHSAVPSSQGLCMLRRAASGEPHGSASYTRESGGPTRFGMGDATSSGDHAIADRTVGSAMADHPTNHAVHGRAVAGQTQPSKS
jgi:hypothetical protein